MHSPSRGRIIWRGSSLTSAWRKTDMGLIQINKTPSARELRWFGVLLALFFGVIGILVRFNSGEGPAIAVWGGGATLAAVYAVVPAVRRPLYLGWMYAAFPIGWTVSHLVLAAVYYLALTPIGVLARLFGHNPMQRGFDPAADSYWKRRPPREEDPARYFKQF